MAATGIEATAVVPSNSVNLSDPCDCLYIGVAGDVSVLTIGGSTAVFKSVAVGYLMQACKRVNLTGTTASDILAVQIGNV